MWGKCSEHEVMTFQYYRRFPRSPNHCSDIWFFWHIFCLTLLTGEMLRSADSKQCCIYEGNTFQVPKTFFLIKRNSQDQREFDLESRHLANSILKGVLLGLFLNYMGVSVCGFVHMRASTNEGQNCWIPGLWATPCGCWEQNTGALNHPSHLPHL